MTRFAVESTMKTCIKFEHTFDPCDISDVRIILPDDQEFVVPLWFFEKVRYDYFDKDCFSLCETFEGQGTIDVERSSEDIILINILTSKLKKHHFTMFGEDFIVSLNEFLKAFYR